MSGIEASSQLTGPGSPAVFKIKVTTILQPVEYITISLKDKFSFISKEVWPVEENEEIS